jgi:hypothetical protein
VTPMIDHTLSGRQAGSNPPMRTAVRVEQGRKDPHGGALAGTVGASSETTLPSPMSRSMPSRTTWSAEGLAKAGRPQRGQSAVSAMHHPARCYQLLNDGSPHRGSREHVARRSRQIGLGRRIRPAYFEPSPFWSCDLVEIDHGVGHTGGLDPICRSTLVDLPPPMYRSEEARSS